MQIMSMTAFRYFALRNYIPHIEIFFALMHSASPDFGRSTETSF